MHYNIDNVIMHLYVNLYYNMIDNIKYYIFDSFKINLRFKKLNNQELKPLPFYLSNSYNYYFAEIFNRKIIFVENIFKEPLTAKRYEKQIHYISKAFDMPVVLLFEKLESYNRKRLIDRGINFIALDKQIYLPFLFLDNRNYSVKNYSFQDNLFPAAQVLLLYHLQKKSLERLKYSEIAEIFGYSNMTISRAVKDLQSKNICKVIGNKNLTVEFEKEGKALWDLAISYFNSPVLKIFYMDFIPDMKNICKTNISALSHYSDISYNDNLQYAVSKFFYNREILKNHKNQINQYEGNYYFEVWKYDPGILATNSIVDPLSLYLSFNDNTDERIASALEQLINKSLW